jgi:hypothetical protein
MERLASLVNSPKQFDERNRESRVMVEFHPFFILFWPISPMSLSSVPPFCFGYLTISSFVLHLSADPQHQKKKPKTKSREIYKRN